MARRGLWNEALFRFQQAQRLEPSSFRVMNNLAVAYEATGQFDEALEAYQGALAASPNNRELRRNYSRFIEFYQSFKPETDEDAADRGEDSSTTADGSP
ncbi:MAG: tetratricopeptide repeat protein [Acidobacteriota bacterium]